MVETNLFDEGSSQNPLRSAGNDVSAAARHDSGKVVIHQDEELTAVSIGFMVAMALLMLVPAFLLLLGGVLWML